MTTIIKAYWLFENMDVIKFAFAIEPNFWYLNINKVFAETSKIFA